MNKLIIVFVIVVLVIFYGISNYIITLQVQKETETKDQRVRELVAIKYREKLQQLQKQRAIEEQKRLSDVDSLSFSVGVRRKYMKSTDLIWTRNWTNPKNIDYQWNSHEYRSDTIPHTSKNIIWVRLGSPVGEDHDDIDTFVNRHLPEITHKFVLITTEGDYTVPDGLNRDSVEKLLKNKWLQAWYTQNYGEQKHNKIHHIPIGINLHTIYRPFRSLYELRNYYLGLAQRQQIKINRIWCDVHFGLNERHGNPRKMIKDHLSNLHYVDTPSDRIIQKSVWGMYAKYKYVISVTGNGLDCFRTWEVLGLGGIVITFHTSLDDMLQHERVIFLDEDIWTQQINDLVWLDKQALLLPEYSKYHLTKSMSRQYWLNKINKYLSE